MPTFTELVAAAEETGHPEHFVAAVVFLRMYRRHDTDLMRISQDLAAMSSTSPTPTQMVFSAWLQGESKRHETACRSALAGLGQLAKSGCHDQIVEQAMAWIVEHPGWIEVPGGYDPKEEQ